MNFNFRDFSASIKDPVSSRFSTIGEIFSGRGSNPGLLDYVFILAGFALLIYLIIGGFELLTSGGNPESINRGKGRITHAIIGFIIIFTSYWVIQLLEVILGVSILD
ncbi:hypothetical protein ACFL0Y_01130 [Patescibacteria group bacterium]